jgi:hypothetical protein
MALVIIGRSRCHICGQVITADRQFQTFPPGLFADGTSEYHLNDSAVHLNCLDQLPEAEQAKHAVAEYVAHFE